MVSFFVIISTGEEGKERLTRRTLLSIHIADDFSTLSFYNTEIVVILISTRNGI